MALGTDPEAFESRNGYIVEEQGKPPDFVLEIASERTGSTDVRWKRALKAGPKQSNEASGDTAPSATGCSCSSQHETDSTERRSQTKPQAKATTLTKTVINEQERRRNLSETTVLATT